VERLKAAPLVRCDVVAWSFVGISMAGWNAILSVGLAGVTLLAARVQASSSASQ
jgi:disulfide bond formation protein DsbB